MYGINQYFKKTFSLQLNPIIHCCASNGLFASSRPIVLQLTHALTHLLYFSITFTSSTHPFLSFILARRYTRYLQFRGQSASHWPQVWLGDGPRPARVMEVKLIREQEPRSDVDKKNDENAENHLTGGNPVAGDGKQSRASGGSGGSGSGSGSGDDDYKVRGSANEGLIFYLGDNKDSSAGADHHSNGINGKGERLAKEKDPLGYSPGRELIRLGPINKKLRSILKFSPGDVYSAPKAVCDSIPLRGSAPVALFDEVDRLNGTATKFAINSTAGLEILYFKYVLSLAYPPPPPPPLPPTPPLF